MILVWSRKLSILALGWIGPNLINNPVNSMDEIQSIIGVISGPKGDKGDIGLPGDGSETYSWSPLDASTIWAVAHNLNKYPSVTVVDTLGREILPNITYLDSNLVEIAFAFPVSGTAYLN